MPLSVQPGLQFDALPTRPTPCASLGELFDDICARFSARTAITLGSQSLTYAELNTAAGKIAEALRELHLPANALVAIYLDRSIEMVAAMLGVIQAGAAYLPIDPACPEARVRETLADASPYAMLTDTPRAQALPGISCSMLIASDMLCRSASSPIALRNGPGDLAYVIYTSGSTGRPKGVMVTHANVLRLLQQTQPWFHFTEHDVWTMFHSFAFDFSVWEIWGPLLTGGRLVIVPFAVSRSPEEFYALLAAERVTVLNQTPTAFSMLIQAEQNIAAKPLALRLVILGGEALTLRSLLPWFACHGDMQPEIVNMYGITETTVHVTYRRILQSDAEHETDSIIGEPIPDLSIHLLDDSLRPVADGEIGEICVGGAGVSLGYLNRPELTAERFIADPFAGPGGRLYRSGDLARRRGDGELVYLGRADRQVKINGFRIELGEIEAVLASCPGVAQVCVAVHSDALAGQRLAAYLVASGNQAAMKAAKLLADQHLPAHMRPAFYLPMNSLPMNINGKVDRNALPLPERVTSPLASTATTNGSSLEAQITAVWQRVLQTETIGLDDNFFDAGGTSLLLLALRTELQAALDRTIPVTWLFEHTTIRSLAARLICEAAPTISSAPVARNKAQQQRQSFERMRALRSAVR